jgi:hypothetical protein
MHSHSRVHLDGIPLHIVQRCPMLLWRRRGAALRQPVSGTRRCGRFSYHSCFIDTVVTSRLCRCTSTGPPSRPAIGHRFPGASATPTRHPDTVFHDRARTSGPLPRCSDRRVPVPRSSFASRKPIPLRLQRVRHRITCVAADDGLPSAQVPAAGIWHSLSGIAGRLQRSPAGPGQARWDTNEIGRLPKN